VTTAAAGGVLSLLTVVLYVAAMPHGGGPPKPPSATLTTAVQFFGMAQGVRGEGATLAEAALLLAALALTVYLAGRGSPALLRGAAALATAGIVLLPLEVVVAAGSELYLAGVASVTRFLLPALLLPRSPAWCVSRCPSWRPPGAPTICPALRRCVCGTRWRRPPRGGDRVRAGRSERLRRDGFPLRAARGAGAGRTVLASLLLPWPVVRRLAQVSLLAGLLTALPANWEWGADAARRQRNERGLVAEAIRARRSVREVAAAAAGAASNTGAAAIERVILRARDAGIEPWAGLPIEGGPGAPTPPAASVPSPAPSPVPARLR
jgi:hypothetical protein